MTTFDEVMAEEWIACGDHIEAGAGTAESPRFAVLRAINGDPESPDVRVAVLGKRALALVLKNEWCGTEAFTDREVCPECAATPAEGHAPTCEWGVICDEARKMRGGR